MNSPAVNPLPTLADEIVTALPGLMIEHPAGPSLARIASTLSAAIGDVRRAARQLNIDARADLMRRMDSREQFLLPRRTRKISGLRYCVSCGKAFEPPPARRSSGVLYYSDSRSCSRSCWIAWSWTKPGVRERRGRNISKALNTPAGKARLASHNKRRWSRPGERRRLAEQNRREWADPVKKALRTQSIKAVNGSPEKRKFYSELRKRQWKEDPAFRDAVVAGIRRHHRSPEARAKFSKLLKARWQDPVLRKKYLAAVRRTGKLAAERNRGRKQPASRVAKRAASRKATTERRRAGGSA